MSSSRLHITAFLLTALVWWIVLLVQGTPVTLDHLRPFGTVVGFLLLFSLVFEHTLWRLPLLHGWFVKRPDLRGTWRIELQSTWPPQRVPLNTCYMGIQQTLFTLQIHLVTKESESWFIADRIHPAPSGNGFQVAGVYTNKPNVDLRGDRSKMHQGALVLHTHGSGVRPETLTGEYWTERSTAGSMNFTARHSKVVTHFDDAEQLFDTENTVN